MHQVHRLISRVRHQQMNCRCENALGGKSFHFQAVPLSDGVEWQTSIHPSSWLISHSGSHGCWSVPAGARHWSDPNGRWDYWAGPIPVMSSERRGDQASSSSHGQHSHLCATESYRSARCFFNRFLYLCFYESVSLG